MMKRGRRGFTLIELVIVVILISVLTAFSIQGYGKMMESSNAEKAREMLRLLAGANRTYALSHEGTPGSPTGLGFLLGNINACDLNVNCENSVAACKLLACGYLAAQDWDATGYDFYALDGLPNSASCGNSGAWVQDPSAAALFSGPSADKYTACAKRKPGASPPYDAWAYSVNMNGGIRAWPAAAPPPLKQD